MILFILCRGEHFRTEFNNISEMRSIIPCDVNVMALTATATSQTRQKVCKSLCMEGCFVFSKSPNKRNIFSVVKGPKMKQQILKPFIDNIRRYGSDRCIVFVHTYEQCEELFFYAAQQLHGWMQCTICPLI